MLWSEMMNEYSRTTYINLCCTHEFMVMICDVWHRGPGPVTPFYVRRMMSITTL